MPVLVKDASLFTKEFLKATSFHTYEKVSFFRLQEMKTSFRFHHIVSSGPPKPVHLAAGDLREHFSGSTWSFQIL